jgi:hypothetical protein
VQVTIAAQVYDFIDKHIKDLDSDLAALAQEIDADKTQLGLKEDETACGRLGVELKRGPRARVGKGGATVAAGADSEAPTKGRRKSKKKEEEALLGEGTCIIKLGLLMFSAVCAPPAAVHMHTAWQA